MKKLPYFNFYPADWRKDPAVQALNYTERGIWIELLCLMHESDIRGYLMLNGKPMTDGIISRILGIPLDEWMVARESLVLFGVCSVDAQNHALFSRRMVRDTKEILAYRKIKVKAGKASAESRKHNKTRGLDGKFAAEQSTEHKPEHNTEHAPNLSSSSSSSSLKDNTNVLCKKNRACALPEDFKISTEMKIWAAENVPRVKLEFETANFQDHHKSKGSTAIDWVASWRTWMRNAESWKKDAPTVPVRETYKATVIGNRNAEMEARGLPKMGVKAGV